MWVRFIIAIFILSIAGCATMSYMPEAPAPKSGDLTDQRVVFLGDSITDGNTHPALVGQALRDAGYVAPTIINAGISGNTAAQMLARLEYDVLAYYPTVVTINAGANDANQKVTPDAFAESITAICDLLDAKEIKVVLITTSPNLTGKEEPTARVEAYAQFMREFAAERGYKLADVNKMMHDATEAGESIMEKDGIHPNLAGHQPMARAVLDAYGYSAEAVPVPERLRALPIPGLVRRWDIRPIEKGTVVDLPYIESELNRSDWEILLLPDENSTEASWWREDERLRGYSPSLPTFMKTPDTKTFLASTTVSRKSAGSEVLNLGGWVFEVWLNGERIYAEKDWRGWHVGHDRLLLPLDAGDNDLVMVVGGDFVASLTQDLIWEDD